MKNFNQDNLDKFEDFLEIKKEVLNAGYPIHMGTLYCFEQLYRNRECNSCESYQGCKALENLCLIAYEESTFVPESTEEMIRKTKELRERKHKILYGENADGSIC
jgi:hypothetical protein